MINFTEQDHRYFSPIAPNQEWVSVTTLLHSCKESFDQIATAAKCSVRKPGKYSNKWYSIPPIDIINAWDGENKRATDLGSWYHKKQEDSWIGKATFCPWKDGVKQSLPQVITEGVYIEFIVYLQSALLTGQVDKIEVKDGILNINDYKTNKEIKRKGFTNWEGISKKLFKPVQHLEDCEFNIYALQLSLYAFILLRHNMNLKLGKLTIEHVKFRIDGKDKFGYPISYKDENGEPVVESVELIELPYMHKECIALTTWMKDIENRKKITKH